MITERQARRRRRTLWILIVIGLSPAAIWGVVPKEAIETERTFDPASIGDDPSAYLARRDSAFDDITPGAEKSIYWGAGEGERTDVAIVYLHGFSATAQEIRPVPERVAGDLAANVVFTRLTGHGRGGRAMTSGSVGAWLHDLDEALAIADMVGERTVIIGTSTGGTIATLALANGRQADGVILVSPNFRLADPLSFVLTLPGARAWVPALMGDVRSFEPWNADHARYWTTSYPTAALFQMAAAVEAARSADHAAIATPALFHFSDADTVVDHGVTRQIAAAWGGPANVNAVELTEGSDPDNHVIAGDILSAGMNDATVAAFAGWIRGLD